jgi:multidrug efflux pump subunit AcrB
VGVASRVFTELRPLIEAIKLPDGYSLEWGGEYEDSTRAKRKVGESMPLGFLGMLISIILLFGTARQPLIIILTLPLSAIGVTFGLVSLNQAFDFMSLLGYLSLTGMIIKNAIVLIEQVQIEMDEGRPPYSALVHATVSRIRPVCMAAVTTILGMAPLLGDAFFRGMAVTIMFGLGFATVLTLLVVPCLYSLFYGITRRNC